MILAYTLDIKGKSVREFQFVFHSEASLQLVRPKSKIYSDQYVLVDTINYISCAFNCNFDFSFDVVYNAAYLVVYDVNVSTINFLLQTYSPTKKSIYMGIRNRKVFGQSFFNLFNRARIDPI